MTRISPVNREQASEKANELLTSVEKKLGSTPNIFTTIANSTSTLEAYLGFSEALAGGTLSAKQRELIALIVGQSNGCDYCLAAHSTIGKMVGLTEDQITGARSGNADGVIDQAVVNLARKLVELRGRISDEDYRVAKEAGLNDSQIVEIVGNVSLNIFTNYFNHVADTEVDFPEATPLSESCSNMDCGCSA